MLTPQEISEKVFVRAVFNGYDMSGVDDFLETVAADYSALYKENAILKSKIKVLVEKVEEYRSTEDSMRMALLTAQRMGEDIVTDANKKSAELLSRTEAEIRDKLVEMNDKLADEEARLKAAVNETAKFVEVSQALMRRHSDFLSKLDKIKHAVEPAPVQKPPPEPTREEKIADAASQIDSAVEKLTGEPEPPREEKAGQAPGTQQNNAEPEQAQKGEAGTGGPVYDDESEPTKLYVRNNEEDSVTPRPKFDFDNLKFGANFSNDD